MEQSQHWKPAAVKQRCRWIDKSELRGDHDLASAVD